jgi:hypothetical protein
VVEGARLESVYTGNGIAGSNPALSAFARRSPEHSGRRRASPKSSLEVCAHWASADAVRFSTYFVCVMNCYLVGRAALPAKSYSNLIVDVAFVRVEHWEDGGLLLI